MNYSKTSNHATFYQIKNQQSVLKREVVDELIYLAKTDETEFKKALERLVKNIKPNNMTGGKA